MLVFVAAAALLAVERVTYAWVWNKPRQFASLSAKFGGLDPVDALEQLFRIFKVLQVAVFVAWTLWYGMDGSPSRPGTAVLAGGLLMIASGQILSFAVFRRLGRVGVFYGARFGHHVPWCTGFPFSLVAHPQYVGALLSIWGFFLIARFPNPDWIMLPLLETVYYGLGARFEHRGDGGRAVHGRASRRAFQRDHETFDDLFGLTGLAAMGDDERAGAE